MADGPVTFAKRKFEDAVYKVLTKFGYPSGGTRGMGPHDKPRPPYERQAPPGWIYEMRRNQALVNNAIEEKVNQTFRRGFNEWEKAYVAKCVECKEEFETVEPFRKQLGEHGDELEEEDFDFEKPRICPNCGEMSDMVKPDPEEKEFANAFFEQANERGHVQEELEPDTQNSVGQSFLEVMKEVAWDIQSFDDGWMVFERSYYTDQEGKVTNWELEGAYRAPPELMRYSVDEKNEFAQDKWVCLECRATKESYQPQETGKPCQCGNKTYPVYAELLENPGGDPVEYFIRGEFVHKSEYEPSRYYGFSPILSVWEEARTLEQMDSWYKEAYEQRRAPRGAMVVRSSNAESVRAWNMEQMEALKDDPQYIPTFMDDTEGKGKPLTWEPLLEEPAQMQHMQMREWFMDRISAKFGVTSIFQSASPRNSGLSQSMEIVVSNRSAMRLKKVMEDYLDAFIGQLHVEGWERDIAEIEEEDEMAEAQRKGKELQNIQLALNNGLEAEWTPDETADIKAGMAEMQEGGEGGMAEMLGGGGEPSEGNSGPGNPSAEQQAAGADGDKGGRPYEPNQLAGEPHTQAEPGQDDFVTPDGAKQDNAVTTQTSGMGNATYSGQTGGVIDIFEHIEEQLTDENDTKQKRKWLQQAKQAYDVNFKNLGINADIIEEYATDNQKDWHQMKEENYGRWAKLQRSEEAAKYLYQLFQGVAR